MNKLKELLKLLFPDKAEIIDKTPIDDAPSTTTTPVVTPSAGDPETKKLVEMMVAENKKLLEELAAVKKQDLDRQKLLEEKAKAERQKEIEGVIKKAVDEKRLEGKNEEKLKFYKELLEANFEAGKKVIEDLKPIAADVKPGDAAQTNQPSATTGNKILDAVKNHTQAAFIQKPYGV